MALLNAILEKVKSNDSFGKKLSSPPPEIDESFLTKSKKKKNGYKVRNCNPISPIIPT